MTACAAFGKDNLSARQLCRIFREVGFPSRSVLQLVRSGCLQEEEGHIRRLRLGCLPVGGIVTRGCDLYRRDGFAAGQRFEMQQPFFAEQSDVEEDAIECPYGSDRVRSIFQNVWRPGVIRWLKKLRQWSTLDIVVELPVVQIAAAQGFVAPALGHFQPWAQLINCIHGARVVDVIGRDQRGIECARTRSVENLIREAALVGFPCKDAIDPEVLGPDIGTEILPFRVLRVVRWLHRVRPDMTEPAGHADTIGFHQVLREVVTRIFVVARRVPFLGGLFIKVGIGEEPQSHNACCITVE